jgi:hypothetical protein
MIGALGGYFLIKQAMSQSYEAVEYILAMMLNRPIMNCWRLNSMTCPTILMWTVCSP